MLSMMAIAAVFATSCQKDLVEGGEGTSTVSFSVGSPEIATRAFSDGTTATVLQYAVYDVKGNELTDLTKSVANQNAEVIHGSTTVNLKLTTGNTYSVIFWAGAEESPYTVDFANKTMTVDYSAVDCNDENLDAFYKYYTFTVKGTQTETIELKRPFAQLNVGAGDYDDSKSAGYEPKYSAVTVKQIFNTLDLVEGEVSNPQDVTFNWTEVPATEAFPVAGYDYLSMNYLLVGADKSLIEVLFSYDDTTDGDADHDIYPAKTRTVGSVPVQRNYRTNIYGQLFTSDVDINVVIEPTYLEPAYEADALELIAAIGGTYNATKDIDMASTSYVYLWIDQSSVFNMNGHTLKAGDAGNYGVVVNNGAAAVLNDANIVSNGGAIAAIEGGHVIFNSGSAYVDTASTSGRYIFYLEGDGSTVTINGGDFSWDPADNQKRAYIYAGTGTTAYVNGGNFGKASTRSGYTDGILGDGTVIIKGGTFGFDPSKWVADGYKAVKVGTTWYVVSNDTTMATTSDDVEAGFANGGNVILAGDVTLDERLNVAEGAKVNLDMNGKTITLEGTSADPAFYTYKGSTLTITGNGKVVIKDPSVSLIFPGGDVVIENGTFIREVPAGTPANQVGALIVGAKVSPWGSQTITINGGYFDGGYYNADAADIDEILAGTKTFTETADDIAKRGNSKDANAVRVAIKQNVQLTLNLSYNLMKIYGGTFVGVNPAWGDEGCMLPTTPNYLRPWSYYQGALLDGQTFNENGLVIPAGYEITKGATADGRPTYTVTYNK